MAELKKCPFCGGGAKADWYIDDGNETHWFIYCCDCSCELSFNAKISKEQAIEAWNNRVTEADIRAKAIAEFAEKMKWEIKNSIGISKRVADFTRAVIDMVAEQLKGE